jgi:hypothetical protein
MHFTGLLIEKRAGAQPQSASTFTCKNPRR